MILVNGNGIDIDCRPVEIQIYSLWEESYLFVLNEDIRMQSSILIEAYPHRLGHE